MIIDQELVDQLTQTSASKPKKARGVLYSKLVASTVMLTLLAGSTVGTASMPTGEDVQTRTVQSASIGWIEPAGEAPDNAVSTPAIEPIVKQAEPIVEPVALDSPCLDSRDPSEPTMTDVEKTAFEAKCHGQITGYIKIPRLWQGSESILMGTTSDVIGNGDGYKPNFIGQYAYSSMTGGKGKPFAITGHSGLGDTSPFTYIEKLVPGDIATVITNTGTFTYEYTSLKETSPDDDSVLLIPPYHEKDAVEVLNKQTMVITTCAVGWFGWGDTSKRRIAYFDLVDFVPSV